MADGKQPGKAGQHHQAQAHDRIDQDEGQLREQVLRHQPGRRQQQQAQQPIPEAMAVVLGQAQVLLVTGLEQKAHQTFFLRRSPNSPLGLTMSMMSTTT